MTRDLFTVARRVQAADNCTSLSLYGDAPSYLVDLITPSAVASAGAGRRSAESMTVAVSNL